MFVFYKNTKRGVTLALDSSEVIIQSDISIDFIGVDQTTNLVTFDKDDLEGDQEESQDINFNIETDGKIVLTMKIDNVQHEGILIPYVTNGMTISSIHIDIDKQDGGYFIIGEYNTGIENSHNVHTKLEKLNR